MRSPLGVAAQPSFNLIRSRAFAATPKWGGALSKLECPANRFEATALSLGGLRRRIEALLMPDSRGRAAGARPRRRARPAAQGRRAGPRTGVAAVGRIAALIKAAQPQISNRKAA